MYEFKFQIPSNPTKSLNQIGRMRNLIGFEIQIHFNPMFCLKEHLKLKSHKHVLHKPHGSSWVFHGISFDLFVITF